MSDWDGKERRQLDTEAIMQMLHSIQRTMERHIEEEKQLRPKLEELLTLLERSKGVVWLFKGLMYVGAPVVAIVYWVKDHVKL